MKKLFGTLAVVGAWSGVVLEEGGMTGIHEVFDHLYPGIMTIGLMHMAKNGSKELLKQLPALAELPQINPNNYEEVGRLSLKKFGPTLEVDGPV